MALFSATEFKLAEGISHNNFDTLIAALANRVTAFFDRYCNRVFEIATYTEEYNGNGGRELILMNPPINSITSIKVSDSRDWSGSTALDSTYYVYDGSGIITLTSLARIGSIVLIDTPVFPYGVRNVQVVYSGGYRVTGSPITLPEDLKQGAMLMASAWFNRQRKGGIQALTAGGTTTAFDLSRVIPTEVKAILDCYKAYPVLGGHS